MADYIAAVAELDFGQTAGIPAQNTRRQRNRDRETETETEAGRKTVRGGDKRGERTEEKERGRRKMTY